MITSEKRRIIIRIGQQHLSFSTIDPMQISDPITYEPYVLKSGISIPANLREALSEASLRETDIRRALVMVDAPVLLIPVEQFEESTMETMYNQAFPPRGLDMILYNVLSDLNCVAVFAISKDMNTVLHDNFIDVQYSPVMAPVWRHLHRRSFTGPRNKLYGYFHDRKVEIFSFHQNRFKFSNQFEAGRPQNALYFLLYVWKQLMLNPENDEMHLVGEIYNAEEQLSLTNELRSYVKKVYVINPSAEFNRAPATKVAGLPFDLMTMYTKGR